MFTLLASLISPFFLEVAPEVRTTYVSLGKILEDRPMQVTSVRAGWDSGTFGRFGVRNWDVSSLTDRKSDVHRHFLYHTEFGPTWQYDWKFANEWTYRTDLTYSWTIYDGFEEESSNKTYQWVQVIQSVENPFVVPFYTLRRCFINSDYLYFKLGARRKFAVWKSLYVTPSVFVEGGNGRNLKRVLGAKGKGETWGAGGVSSISFRLEAGWRFNEYATLFAAVEQYEIIGHGAREANSASSSVFAHNDWTHASIGVRMSL